MTKLDIFFFPRKISGFIPQDCSLHRCLTVNYVSLENHFLSSECKEIILSSNWRDTIISSVVSGYYEEPSRVQSTCLLRSPIILVGWWAVLEVQYALEGITHVIRLLCTAVIYLKINH